MAGFEWDENNIGHIARHGVTPAEVEEVFANNPVVERTKDQRGEPRFFAYGRTIARRFLVVLFTLRNELIRPITAYPMNRTKRKLYVPQLDDEK